MNFKLICCTLIIITFFNGQTVVDCANILIVWPMYVRSHIKSFQPLFEELVNRKHNVTLISGYRLKDSLQPNYTFVDVSSAFPKTKLTNFIQKARKIGYFQIFKFGIEVFRDYADRILSLEQVQDVIQSDSNYDLIISELLVLDVFFAFGNKFSAPTIALTPMKLIPYYSWILCEPFPSSYVPSMTLAMTEKMTFVSRLINTVIQFYSVLMYELYGLPGSQKLIEKHFHFDKDNVPHIKDIMKNISVTFVTSHYSLGYIKPQLPNIINLAGLHLAPPNSLPLNLQKFMDEAESGVVFLSLGSTVEPSSLDYLGDTFIKILGNLPHRVIMKWDPKLLRNIPDNILVQEWTPQNEILNHPKSVLFITQGGIHSCLETLNASVPVVGIPVFSDQQHNLAMMEYYEIGTVVQLEDVPTKLASKVNEVLNNPKYKNNIKKRSMLYQDRLVKPLDEAMYWVDHVIKYKTTDHLKSAALQLSWYELYSLDVLLILIPTIISIIHLTKTCLMWLLRKLKSLKNKWYGDAKLDQKEFIDHAKFD